MEIEDKYLNSNGLNIYLACDSNEVDRAIDRLYEDLYKGKKGQHKRVARNHLRILLLNFIELLQTKPDGYIYYSRDTSYWVKLNKRTSNPYRISTKIIEIADSLSENGLAEQWLGDAGRYQSYQTRIKPLPLFIERYITPYNFLKQSVVTHLIETHKKTPLVRIRVKKKNREGDQVLGEEQRWDARTQGRMPKSKIDGMEGVLKRYNSFLEDTEITLKDTNETEDAFYNYGKKRIYRSFVMYAASDAFYSGRFYGGWWIRAKKKHRPHILINGEPTVELDYKAQHPYMLYGWRGKSLQTAIGSDDPYIISKPDGSSYYRGIAKDVFMMCMNGSGRRHIRRILMNGTPEKGFKNGYKYTIANTEDEDERTDAARKMEVVGDKKSFDAFMQAFLEVHHSITDAFYQDWWTMCQTFDAHICEYVIDKMTHNGIPVLSVHDSFICAERHKDILEQVMKDAYAAHEMPSIRGALPPIVLKNKEEDGEALVDNTFTDSYVSGVI